MTMVDCSGIKGVVECTEDSPRRRIWLRIPELGDQVAFRTTQIVWRPTDVSLAWCWTVIVVGDTDEQSRRVVVEAHSVDGDARFRHVRWWEIPRSVGRRLCRGAHRETTVRAVVEELLGDLVLSRELAGDGFVLEEPNADSSIPEGSESDGEPDYDSFVENCDPIALDWAKAVELDFNRTQPALVDAASRALAQNRLVARNWGVDHARISGGLDLLGVAA